MARLSRAQATNHQTAERLLQKDVLSYDEREFVINNWQESAKHINSVAGAFFTPLDLAWTFAIEARGADQVVDLCAGIGVLAFAVHAAGRGASEIVCIETNPDYVAVGRKVLPEARWICASVDDLPSDLGRFRCAIGNPPFGNRAKIKGPRYSGEDELAVIDIASDLAEYGCFIIPQMSAPFEYSGRQHYQERPSAKYERFHAATGIELGASCGIDCDFFKGAWRGVSPCVEVVTTDFEDVQRARLAARPRDLFSEAA